MNHLELFSGIGGFRHALDLLSKDFDLEQNTVAYSEIDQNALTVYKSCYDIDSELDMGDIVSFNQSTDNYKLLPNIDLVTGGFPCQAFSMMGKQRGFDDVRGNVFFQIINVLENKKPTYVLLENVRNLKTHDKGRTFSYIIESLKNIGYDVVCDVFDSSDFGLAQRRNRVFIFATNKKLSNIEFNHKKVKESFDKIKNSTSLLLQDTTLDVLDKTVDKKYYLSDVIKPTILADGSRNYKSKSDINPLIARPLTATMAKMHRACQDNYFSDGYILSDNPHAYSKIEFTKKELCAQNIRRLTPKEAFNLQGFSNSFFNRVKRTGVSDSQLYKQAGNAVSVNTVYAILHYLFITCHIGG